MMIAHEFSDVTCAVVYYKAFVWTRQYCFIKFVCAVHIDSIHPLSPNNFLVQK